MAAALLRGLPLLRHCLHCRCLTLGSLSLRPWLISVESIPPDDKTGPSTITGTTTIPRQSARDPLLCHRLHRRCLTLGSLSLRPWFTSVKSIPPDDKTGPSTTTQTTTIPGLSARDSLAKPRRSWDDPDYRKWKDKEAEILEDIEPVISLAKEIIHSNRYMDGERLTAEDEKTVIERLLAYHPHSEDKIGCGLDSIMVDRHPQFRCSRCLFVVRTDGGWIDFSYQKCVRAYIRHKYPSQAERFIKEHFKRSSS